MSSRPYEESSHGLPFGIVNQLIRIMCFISSETWTTQKKSNPLRFMYFKCANFKSMTHHQFEYRIKVEIVFLNCERLQEEDLLMNTFMHESHKVVCVLGSFFCWILPCTFVKQAASCKSALPYHYHAHVTNASWLFDQGQTLTPFKDHFRSTLTELTIELHLKSKLLPS